tara:strand:+ start:472 stop:1452 length:981 start_codon:yes stop_codon:yes gene_type:complete
MNNIRVSHESPLALLDHSKHYNDFDYCLTHLLDEQPTYREFFKKQCLDPAREVLFDASIFELGYMAPGFPEHVAEFKPTSFIVPDVLDDMKGTIDSWKDFTSKYPDLPGRRIGVVQGKTFEESLECYEFMTAHADMIAISFDCAMYSDPDFVKIPSEELQSYGDEKQARWCFGRITFVDMLVSKSKWCLQKPVHLLGCSLPREFQFYRDNRLSLPNIYSIDTSNPVTAGMNEVYYDPAIGLKFKPKTKLFERVGEDISSDQLNAIIYNLEAFKEFIGRESDPIKRELIRRTNIKYAISAELDFRSPAVRGLAAADDKGQAWKDVPA